MSDESRRPDPVSGRLTDDGGVCLRCQACGHPHTVRLASGWPLIGLPPGVLLIDESNLVGLLEALQLAESLAGLR